MHSSGQCAISLWFDNGVQEGDGPILLVVLHCKLCGRVNTINVLKEALFVDLLVDEKGVIHIPAPVECCESTVESPSTAVYCNWAQRVNYTSIGSIHASVYKPKVLPFTISLSTFQQPL